MQCNIASGSIAVLSLEVLEQSFEFAIYIIGSVLAPG